MIRRKLTLEQRIARLERIAYNEGIVDWVKRFATGYSKTENWETARKMANKLASSKFKNYLIVRSTIDSLDEKSKNRAERYPEKYPFVVEVLFIDEEDKRLHRITVLDSKNADSKFIATVSVASVGDGNSKLSSVENSLNKSSEKTINNITHSNIVNILSKYLEDLNRVEQDLKDLRKNSNAREWLTRIADNTIKKLLTDSFGLLKDSNDTTDTDSSSKNNDPNWPYSDPYFTTYENHIVSSISKFIKNSRTEVSREKIKEYIYDYRDFKDVVLSIKSYCVDKKLGTKECTEAINKLVDRLIDKILKN